ncbi:type II secretion system F family protein [Pseudoalteromonas fenneropenaei]|uniref:Type II secretion system F family protein n=1 Tax=Pseudoalteromonas fenneropenaei TaxID=1737459 RepID=A0ABV7CKI6_9GAMM
MEFEYKAIDTQGSRHEGVIDANDRGDALVKLNEIGLTPITLKEIRRAASINFFKNKVNPSDLEFFTNELSLLLESGIKVDKAIDIIKKSNANSALTALLNQISTSLKQGVSLSDAFGKHEKIFGSLYVQLIKIGEASGNLSEVLKKLAKDLKFQMELRNQVSTALTYPSVILFVCISAVYFVLTFIVPKMSGIFTDLDSAPWYTQAIVKASAFFSKHQLYFLLVILTLIISLTYFLKKVKVREWFYVHLSRFPGIGKVIITSERIRFSQSVAMMLDAGLQLDICLELTLGTLKHPDFRRDTKLAVKHLKSGKQLCDVLSKTRIFPSFFLSIIKVGEETNRLDIVFADIAARSRSDLENLIRKLTSMLEPLMLLFMGGFVGGIVIVMLMSMVSINDVPI